MAPGGGHENKGAVDILRQLPSAPAVPAHDCGLPRGLSHDRSSRTLDDLEPGICGVSAAILSVNPLCLPRGLRCYSIYMRMASSSLPRLTSRNSPVLGPFLGIPYPRTSAEMQQRVSLHAGQSCLAPSQSASMRMRRAAGTCTRSGSSHQFFKANDLLPGTRYVDPGDRRTRS